MLLMQAFCNRLRLVIALAGSACLAACASSAPIVRNAPPSAALSQVAVVPGFTGIRSWGDYVPKNAVQEYRRLFPGVPLPGKTVQLKDGRPVIRVLALSGGGPDGAFGAGLLAGWTASGTRPQFDFVTGISAGALIAPFAFLGSAHDASMREIWTQYETSELITAQLLPGLFGGASLADTAPMAKLIAKYVDGAFLARIAAEYDKGRVLLVGTTNLDAQRPVVWNMGEIARKGTPEAVDLFRRILLASAAIPGAFPPVQIKVEVDGQMFDELHVDGGTTREVFVGALQVPIRDLDKAYPVPPLREIYIIKNGKLGTDYQEIKPKTLSIASRAISTLLQRQNAGDIYRIYRTARDGGAEFKLIAVPETFATTPAQAFDPAYQLALYETGFKMARSGVPWLNIPPELLPTPPVTAAQRALTTRSTAQAAPAQSISVFDVLGSR